MTFKINISKLLEKERSLKSSLSTTKDYLNNNHSCQFSLTEGKYIKFPFSYEDNNHSSIKNSSYLFLINIIIEKMNYLKKIFETPNELIDIRKVMEKINDHSCSITESLDKLKAFGELQGLELNNDEKTIITDIKNLSVIIDENPEIFAIARCNDKNICDEDTNMDNLSTSCPNKSVNYIGSFKHNLHNNDHKIFLQIFNLYHTSLRRKKDLYKNLSHMPKEEIDSHYAKFTKFLKRSQDIKERIKLWRRELKQNEEILPEESEKNENVQESNPIKKKLKKIHILKSKTRTKKNILEHADSCNMKLQNSPNKRYQYSQKERQDLDKKLKQYKKEKNQEAIEKEIKQKEAEEYHKEQSSYRASQLAKLYKRDSKICQEKLELVKKLTKHSNHSNYGVQKVVSDTKNSRTLTENYLKVTVSHLTRIADVSQKPKKNSLQHIDFSKKRGTPVWRVID